jgi:hypothetical protein
MRLTYDSVILLKVAYHRGVQAARCDREERDAQSIQDGALTAILLAAASHEAFINELPEHVRIWQREFFPPDTRLPAN